VVVVVVDGCVIEESGRLWMDWRMSGLVLPFYERIDWGGASKQMRIFAKPIIQMQSREKIEA
jgi:hypothetical protein